MKSSQASLSRANGDEFEIQRETPPTARAGGRRQKEGNHRKKREKQKGGKRDMVCSSCWKVRKMFACTVGRDGFSPPKPTNGGRGMGEGIKRGSTRGEGALSFREQSNQDDREGHRSSTAYTRVDDQAKMESKRGRRNRKGKGCQGKGSWEFEYYPPIPRQRGEILRKNRRRRGIPHLEQD